MSEELTNWLIGSIASLCAAIGFLYKREAKLKEAHHATMIAMLTDAKEERAACQKENELMRQDITNLQKQLLKLHQEHGELKGRFSEIRKEHDHV